MNDTDLDFNDSIEANSQFDSILREVARGPEVIIGPADINRVGTSIGKFLVRRELGRGGMGIVYVAEDAKLRRDVALKVLPATFVDEERKRRFLGEARAAARISHPNVTAVFEVGEDAGSTFIAMEYVDGRTLRKVLQEHGGAALPIPQALRIARAITDGLESAHIAGVIHRDLKPENVMLARNGHVKILDFGLAKFSVMPDPIEGSLASAPNAEASAASTNEQATGEGRILGTPSYMSPEQAAGEPLDLRSDLFSLGVILYELVTGVRPFSGNTIDDLLIAIAQEEPVAASKRNSSVSPKLERLLARCLAKRPEERCEGAFEIRTVIDQLLAADHASVSPPIVLTPMGIIEPTLLGKPAPYVGRDRELATLMSLYNESIETPLGCAVLVTAPAGMGKSRLMREILRIVRQQRGAGVSIWAGPGDPLCVDSAFGVLGHALSDECGIRMNEPLEQRRAKLEARVGQTVPAIDRRRIAEFLGELIGAPFRDDESAPLRAARQDSELMAEQMRRAFLDFVAAETARRPLLIVLEDLHWSDEPTVRFINAALHAHGDKPFLVLALARPEVHERFPKLWAMRDVHQIHLKPLSAKAAGTIVRQALGQSANDTIVERIVGLADGHAFYLEELIRTTAEGQHEVMPATVIAMVQARLMDVDDDARRLLRAASIFGEVFWQSAVEDLTASAAGPLRTLIEREIILRHVDSRFPGEREYAFRHALLREGAYAMVTDSDLVMGHRLAAEWLEQRGERNPMVIAEHFERGGCPERSSRFYAQAAAQALRANDLDGAISCAKRGLACDTNGDNRLKILAVLGEAHCNRYDYDLGLPLADELMRIAAPGSAPYVAAAKWRMAWALLTGKFDEFFPIVDAVYAVDPSPEAVAQVADMLLAAVAIPPLVGLPELATGYLEKLQTLSQGPGKENPIARGQAHFAQSFMHLAVAEQAWSGLQEAMAARRYMEEAGYRPGVARALIQMGVCAWMLGASEWAFRGLMDPIAADPDIPQLAAHRVCVMVDLLLARGDLEAARREALALIERAKAKQMPVDEGFGRYALARVLFSAGNYDTAASEAILAGELIVFPVYRMWPDALIASIRLAQGRTAEALNAARQAFFGCESLGNFGYRGTEIRLGYALALDASGNREKAQQCISSSIARIRSIAATIDDPAMRQSFLEDVSANAQTLKLARDWLGDGS